MTCKFIPSVRGGAPGGLNYIGLFDGYSLNTNRISLRTIPMLTPRSLSMLFLSLACASLEAQSAAAPNPFSQQPGTKSGNYGFPPVDKLPDIEKMPDPFRKPDGTRVQTRAEWKQQRTYLRSMLEHYLYGHIPPRPGAKEVSAIRTADEPYTPPNSKIEGRKQSYRITLARNSLTHQFNINLWRPAALKRYPALINNRADDPYGAEEGVRRGYMFVEYNRTGIAPDDPNNKDRHAGVFRLYPEYDFYTIAAWAWGYQVVVDVLDHLGVADRGKIIVTGHSRGGQAAMAGGVFDESIAIVAPSTGGPNSVGSIRQRDPESFRGRMDYSKQFQQQNPHWFHPRYFEFAGRQNKFPWDAATLVSLVAPRPLLNLNAVGDGINNALAHEAGIRAGVMIYRWWDAENWCRLHWRGETNEYGQKGHDQGPEEFNAIYDFADEFFFAKPRGPSTFNVWPKSETWRYDPAKYPLLVDWKIPAAR